MVMCYILDSIRECLIRVQSNLSGLTAVGLSAIFVTGMVANPACEALGQNPLKEQPNSAKVMILGTAHFANPGQDVINPRFPDVYQSKYQRQIEAVVDSLAGFRPTKIAVEVRPDYEAKFDSLYQAYLRGDHELSRNERQQLGFRLAEQFGHDRLLAIDHEGEFPFKEVMQFAQKHDSSYVNFFEEGRDYIKSANDSLYSHASIQEILRQKNSDQELMEQRAFYARTAAVGNDTTWVGAELVSKWHKRNIKIFGHLARITDPGDRIIVIFGSGHSPLLRYFVESSIRMKLVDPLEYL